METRGYVEKARGTIGHPTSDGNYLVLVTVFLVVQADIDFGMVLTFMAWNRLDILELILMKFEEHKE